MGKLGAMLRDRLVRPILAADASVEAVSWGAAMGVLTALLPTFGIQMYVAFGLWAGWRWAFGKTFNLPACFAASWVMNPLTVVPIYYAYYWTGDTIWDAITVPTPDWTFGEFEDLFLAAISPKGGVWYERLFGGVFVLLNFFGWPIVLGSILWSLPLSMATYFGTRWGLLRYRARAAANAAHSRLESA